MSGDTRSAKNDVADVMSDLSSVVNGREERSEPMDTRVEDITPVLLQLRQYNMHVYRFCVPRVEKESNMK